jgi:CHASE2 domain-containing sensor protein
VFSLGDLFACAQDGDDDFFRKHFDDKVVLFGRTDAPQSRQLAATRFLDLHTADRYAARCRLPVMESLAGLDNSRTTPEVVIAATAVRNLLQRDVIKTLPGYAVVLVAVLLALATALAVLRIATALVAPALLLLLAGWGYLAVVMLREETWLMPLAQPGAAIVIAFAGALGYRTLRGRFIRQRA